MIPTQCGAPDDYQPVPKHSEQKPIMAPWTRDRAEFVGKIGDLAKRTVRAALWHLWHAPANAL